MIFSIIPWAGIFSGPDADPYSWELGWWFPELTALFIVAAVRARRRWAGSARTA